MLDFLPHYTRRHAVEGMRKSRRRLKKVPSRRNKRDRDLFLVFMIAARTGMMQTSVRKTSEKELPARRGRESRWFD